MNKPAFIDALRSLSFRESGKDQYERRNRDVAHDDDCSDDERDDSFYERAADKFNDWARPILKCVGEAEKAYGMKVDVILSSEYGFITINIK